MGYYDNKWFLFTGGGFKPLIFDIDTTKAGSANDTFILPTTNIGTYDARISWGDGSSSTITAWNDADLTHVYPATGVYTVRIYGSFPTIRFNNVGDRLKMINVKQWGDWVPLLLTEAFFGCENLVGTFTDKLNLSQVTNLTSTFRKCYLFNGNVTNFNTSTINALNLTFSDCYAFNKQLNWNVSNVTNFGTFLGGASSFNQNLSTLNFGNLTINNLNAIFLNSGMSIANYTDTIVGWANKIQANGYPFNVSMTLQTGMTFDTSRVYGTGFSDAGSARTYLTTLTGSGGAGWTISGDTVI